MEKITTIIPPKGVAPATLRVAAYCRVSTDAKEQELSYASQIRNYTDLISRHDGWVKNLGCVIFTHLMQMYVKYY